MKRYIKIAVIVLVVAFIAVQFYRPSFENPAVVQAETLEASTFVPADVEQILTTSCNDCHSNKTVYPWYSKISPSSWFLNNHITEGRGEMNFSVWNTYTDSKKSRKLDKICEEVETKEMPLPSYLWIHRDAVLSESQSKTLCDWAAAEKARIGE